MTGSVRDDEPPLGRREVSVGDVDRDPLLALGAQPVGQQRQIEEVLAAALAGLLDVRQLIAQHLLGVVQEAADKGALAVVDGAGGGEAQEVGGPVGEPAKHRTRSLARELRGGVLRHGRVSVAVARDVRCGGGGGPRCVHQK